MNQATVRLTLDIYYALLTCLFMIVGAMIFTGKIESPLTSGQLTGLVLFLAAGYVSNVWGRARNEG